MFNLFNMAWRNLWRNGKRTIITAVAVVMAVAISTFFTCMQEGTYNKMIDNVVGFYSGYMQVMDTSYWDSRSINDVIECDDKLMGKITAIPNIKNTTRRIESFTLISTGDNTKGCALIGIEPESEDRVTEISKWITEGKYIGQNDDGILLTINIAKQLDANIGDTLVLLSQGYHGASAAGLFPIRGILEFPAPGMNGLGGFISLKSAQEFFSTEGRVTSTIIDIDDTKKLEKTQQQLAEIIGEKFEVMNWQEMQPELVQMIRSDRSGAIVFKVILYMVVGFGIFGTIIMMVQERHRESAVMVALGMKKHRLETIMFFETILMGLLGLVAGLLIIIPVITWFIGHPIPLPEEMSEAWEMFGVEPSMFFTLNMLTVLKQLLIVFAMAVIISLYPVFKVLNMNVIRNMRD